MSLEDKINLLGHTFRGLWKSFMFESKIEMWAVTFLHNGELFETPYCDTANTALDMALEYTGKI